jgi:glutathione peroxidase
MKNYLQALTAAGLIALAGCGHCGGPDEPGAAAGPVPSCPLCQGAVPGRGTLIALQDRKDGEKGVVKVPAVLNFTMNDITGKPVELKKYQGMVVVFVNVASQCGYTPQYQDLQALHTKYADKGLAIVGVPANEFGGQEPGSNAEIAEFCKKNYGVGFDVLGKVVVKGPGQCELYKFLTGKDTNPKFAGDVKWNFEKFVVGRNGEVVARFGSATSPSAAEFVKVIEEELGKK